MSTKEQALLDFWFRALWSACQRRNDYVSAGAVGASVGQTRNTAKKYLEKMHEVGVVEKKEFVAKNGTSGFIYAPVSE